MITSGFVFVKCLTIKTSAAAQLLTTVAASNITNTFQGLSRPVFTYNSATLVQINSIHVDLYTDINPTKAPLESHLTSGVFLRNQNQVPVASFTKALSGALVGLMSV